MVRYHEEFPSKAEAEEWIERIYRNYHPMGYGTHLTVHPPEGERKTWLVTGARGDSCD